MNNSIIAIDLGNTTCEIAFIKNGLILNKFYVNSKNINLMELKNKLLTYNIDFKNQLWIVSSVVPSENNNLRNFIISEFNVNPIFIESGMFAKQFVGNIINNEVGIDILCKSLWASDILKKDVLILDTGTATVLQYINNKGILSGVSITIGFNAIFNQLHLSTNLLPKINESKSRNVFGLNTKDSLQGGVYWGYIGCLNALINKAKEETQCGNIYITGGNSEIFLDDINFNYIHNKNIIFEGMYALYKNNFN